MPHSADLIESMTETKDQLASNLRRVVSDTEDLLAATAEHTDSRIAELRARARENLRIARDKLADADAVVRARARQAAAATDDYVHDNPWRSIGIAAGIGFIVGLLIGRR